MKILVFIIILKLAKLYALYENNSRAIYISIKIDSI